MYFTACVSYEKLIGITLYMQPNIVKTYKQRVRCDKICGGGMGSIPAYVNVGLRKCFEKL